MRGIKLGSIYLPYNDNWKNIIAFRNIYCIFLEVQVGRGAVQDRLIFNSRVSAAKKKLTIVRWA